MTREEYLKTREYEKKSFENRMRELDLNFAKSINKIRISDNIENKFGRSIIVTKYLFNRHKEFYGIQLPHFDYQGIALTRAGVPRKDGTIYTIEYENVFKVNGKEIILEDIRIKKGGNQ